MRIVFDTNFLIDMIKFKVDIEEIEELVGKCNFFIFDSVIEELEKIAKTRKKDGMNAKLALNFLKSRKFKTIKTKFKSTDEAIVNSLEKDSIVATNDSELRKILKAKGIKTIYLRSKKHLEVG
ncbi:MAG: PIN domain-containing protein [Candidatus Aenigmatarchaeota archaeon]